MAEHRFTRRTAPGVSSERFVDPANELSADFAWRAEDCSVSGGVTTQWNPYRGSVALTQGNAGLRAGVPTATSLLGGRLAVPFTADCYTGTVALGDAQTSITICTIPNNGLKGVWSSSNGTVNTGSSVLISTNIQSRRIGAAGAQGAALPANPNAAFIICAVLTLSGERLYINSRTPILDVDASAAFAQSTHALGSLDGAGGQPYTGDIARHVMFNRALTQREVEYALASYGARYSIFVK